MAQVQTSWTVGAVAQMLGVPASTLRSWHRRYGIERAEWATMDIFAPKIVV